MHADVHVCAYKFGRLVNMGMKPVHPNHKLGAYEVTYSWIKKIQG